VPMIKQQKNIYQFNNNSMKKANAETSTNITKLF
jgi:hypothetical protein